MDATSLECATGRTSRRERLRRCLAPGVALLLIVGWLFVALHYWAPAGPSSNENGYLVAGKQLARTGSPGVTLSSPYEFVGQMWMLNPQTQVFYPKYPLGLPIIIAGVVKVFGTQAAWLVPPACGAGALFAMFLLVRRLAGAIVGCLAIPLLGFNQLFLTLSLHPMAHVPALMCVLLGAWLLVMYTENGRRIPGMLGAFLIGYAGTIRYADGLLGACVCVAMLARVDWRRPMSALRGLILPIAWALPIAAHVLLTRHLQGTWTGYDATNESHGFDFRFAIDSTDFGGTWNLMANYVNGEALLGVFALGLFGAVAMTGTRGRGAVGLMLLSWFAPMVLLYTCYYFASSFGYLYSRFILEAAPALMVGACWAIGEWIRRCPSRNAAIGVGAAAGLLVLCSSAVSLARITGAVPTTAGLNGLTNIATGALANANLARTGQQARTLIPAGSLVISCEEEKLLHYLQFAGEYTLLPIERFDRAAVQRILAMRAGGDPAEPMPFDPKYTEQLRAFYNGKTDSTLQRDLLDLIYAAHARGQRVFHLLSPSRTATLQNWLFRGGLKTKPLAQFADPPFPEVDIEPKVSYWRNDRGNPPRQDEMERLSWRIGEILPRPATTSAPSTQPTTGGAS